MTQQLSIVSDWRPDLLCTGTHNSEIRYFSYRFALCMHFLNSGTHAALTRYLVQADFSFLRQRCSSVAPTDILLVPHCKQQGLLPAQAYLGWSRSQEAGVTEIHPRSTRLLVHSEGELPPAAQLSPRWPLPPRGLVLAALLLVAVPALPVTVLPLPAAVPAAAIVPLKVIAALPAVVAVPLVLAGNRVGSEAWM